MSEGPRMIDRFRPRWREGPGPIPRYVVRPTARFIQIEAAGGIVIVIAALAALIWANVASSAYEELWGTEIVLDFDILTLRESLDGWVNDGLMVVFFFVVAMEIKRELVLGELADRRQAALPVMAALGGMIVPALIYTGFNAGGEGASGWGIPVATDIAFALGVLALVGRRVPPPLKVFLLTLAVADDVGGIAIIAFFYTDDISVGWLGAAVGMVGLVVAMNLAGVRAIPVYLIAGLGLWLCVFESGVAATIAGVILGLLTPAAPLYNRARLDPTLHVHLAELDDSMRMEPGLMREEQAGEALRLIEEFSRETQSPLERLERTVEPWAAFLIVPIFALANAGIDLGGGRIPDAAGSDVAIGIAAGLLLGKVVGVSSFTYLAVRLGVAMLPSGVRWSQIGGVALLAGIGFTVAIFIATLSFDETAAGAPLAENAKMGIFAASLVAAVLGYFVLRIACRPGAAGAPDDVGPEAAR